MCIHLNFIPINSTKTTSIKWQRACSSDLVEFLYSTYFCTFGRATAFGLLPPTEVVVIAALGRRVVPYGTEATTVSTVHVGNINMDGTYNKLHYYTINDDKDSNFLNIDDKSRVESS